MYKNDKYEAVIGLEVHAQLNTLSKLFCGDAVAFGADPNTHVSPVSLGHPGTLPVMNEAVIAKAVRLGIALHCEIVQHNYFARKNYFYPDLPKGYQVSQHTAPICLGGYVTLHSKEGEKKVQLNRIHMEEDAGKSLHDVYDEFTCIDLNRAGTPLLEIVTEPCIHSTEEAAAYLMELRKLLRWINASDGNMEEGSLRCDANISIRPVGETKLGTRVEVKNLNSIRNVRKAIEVELERLTAITEKGEKIVQETRSYDADHNTTFSLRSKEDAEDYRYFPEPDLPPFMISDEYLAKIKREMPELPKELFERYKKDFGLSDYDAEQVCADRADAEFFEGLVAHTKHYKAAANWMLGPLKNYNAEHHTSFENFPLEGLQIATMIDRVEEGRVSFQSATTRLMQHLVNNKEVSTDQAIAALNIAQQSGTTELEQWIEESLAAMPDKVKDYKNGKKNLLGLFAGDVKKRSRGQADMQKVTQMLQEKLS